MKTHHPSSILAVCFSVLCIFILSPIGSAQNGFGVATPESVGMSSERLERLNERMHRFVDEGHLSGIQTAIIRKGRLAHYDTYGYQDLKTKTPLSDQSIWRIYSMTKPIVSVGLMMLYEEGKFQLYDPVAKYIPELAQLTVHKGGQDVQSASNPIRVVDILRHTSGLGYGWGPGSLVDSMYQTVDIWSIKNNADFVKKLAELPLYFEPGTAWRYGVSTDVCGRLIEVLSGQPLDKFLRDRILDPLGMVDTHFEVPDESDARFVTNYTPEKDGTLKVIDHPSQSNYTKEVTFFSGGGGMVSTTHDYLVFCQMLLNGGEWNGTRFLSPKTLELMVSDHTKGLEHHGGPVVLPAMGHGFGLGFTMTEDLAASGITGSQGAYGWGGAAGTYFRIDPEEEMIYVMMIQLMPYNHLQARENFQTMVYQAIVD